MLLVVVGCAGSRSAQVSDLPLGDPARRDRPAAVVLDGITETASGRVIAAQELAPALASTRLIFIGEGHTSPGSHEVQRRVIQALVDAGRKVIVGLEMFPTAAQPALDAWSAGPGIEGDFLESTHWYKHWGFPFAYYRDIVLLAHARKLRLVAVNAPRELITAARKNTLDAAQKAQLPPTIDTNSDEHRRLFRAYFAGDAHGKMSDAQLESMYRAQCTWDAVMAWNAVRALRETPDSVMVVLIGSGHVAFGLGAPRQAALWWKERIATILPVPLRDDKGRPAQVRASYADYVWTVPPDPDFPPHAELPFSVTDRKGAVVVVGEPAAGLQRDDRIVSLDGATVADKEALLIRLGAKQWGDNAAFDVQRGTQKIRVNVPLRRPVSP